MGPNILERNRRLWLLGGFAFLGIVYSVLATRLWMMSWIPLLPLLKRSEFFQAFFGPFWFAVELAPITVAVVLLRVQPIAAVFTVWAYYVLMNLTQVASEPSDYRFALLLTMVGHAPFAFILQIPVFGLAVLVRKIIPRGRL